MSHVPNSPDSSSGRTPSAAPQPWDGRAGDHPQDVDRQQAGRQSWGQPEAGYPPAPTRPPAPHPGPLPAWGGPQDPAAVQAAWRYSARAKNSTVAWLLWIGGPFLVGLPIHDFYFGAVLRGLLKLGLIVLVFVALFGGMIASPGMYDTGSTSMVPMMIGLAVAALAALAVIVWWIVDGVRMTRRIEETNERIRREIADEQGVDPWSF